MAYVVPKFSKTHHPITKEEYLLPQSCQQSDLDSALSYMAKPTDVFICSYPKCGTTWLQNITWLIVHSGEQIPSNIRLSMPMLEFDGAEAANIIDDSIFPRIIKTHLPSTWTPHHSEAKYLYISRNPKDAFVSNYFHVLGFAEHYDAIGLQMETLFDLFVKGQVDFGSYFDHLITWHAKRDEPNVLFLLYEDLKNDIRGNILKIASFLGKEYEENLLKNKEELLNTILQLTQFKKMKADGQKWCKASRPNDIPFIRKGEVGDWKNYLTKDQSETLDRILREKGKESGCDQLWK